MRLISSSRYPLTRLVIPLVKQPKVWGTALAVSCLLVVTGLWLLLAFPMLIIMLMVAIHNSPRLFGQNFCRDVWIDETGFLLQLQEQQLRIPFDHVEQITWHGSNNPPRAKIRLNAKTQQGLVFTFVPDLTDGRTQAKKNIESLNAQLMP